MRNLPASRAQTTLWTTIAKEKLNEERRKVNGLVCGMQAMLNAGMLSSNITNHFRSKHQLVYDSLMELNSQHANKTILRASMTKASHRLVKKGRCSNIKSVLQR